jgi:PKD repeat protein
MSIQRLGVAAITLVVVVSVVGTGIGGAAGGTSVQDSVASAAETTGQTTADTLATSPTTTESDATTGAPDQEGVIQWSGAGTTLEKLEQGGDSIHAERMNIQFNQEVDFSANSNHWLEIRNVDTGEAVEIHPAHDASGTFSHSFYFNLYSPRGEIEHRNQTIDDVNVTVEGPESTFTAQRAATYVVTLYDGDTVVGSTSQKRFGIGYTLDYTVIDQGDSYRIEIPRDEMPTDVVVELSLGDPADDKFVNEPLHTRELTYDQTNNVFTTTFDADMLDRMEYSWSVEFYETQQKELAGRILYTYGSEPLALTDNTGPEGPPAVGGFDSPPTDLDGDNLYEDINGDGQFDIADVQAFFQYYEDDAVQNNVAAFDFNGDGSVNIIDVHQLFTQLT